MNYISGLMKKLRTNEEDQSRVEPKQEPIEFNPPAEPWPNRDPSKRETVKMPVKLEPVQTPVSVLSPIRSDHESTRISGSRLSMETFDQTNRSSFIEPTPATTQQVNTAKALSGRRTQADTIQRVEASKASGYGKSESAVVTRKRCQNDTIQRMKESS